MDHLAKTQFSPEYQRDIQLNEFDFFKKNKNLYFHSTIVLQAHNNVRTAESRYNFNRTTKSAYCLIDRYEQRDGYTLKVVIIKEKRVTRTILVNTERVTNVKTRASHLSKSQVHVANIVITKLRLDAAERIEKLVTDCD